MDVQRSIKTINENSNLGNNTDLTVLTDSFRCLRNFCATSPEVQNTIAKDINVVDSTHKILLNIVTKENVTQEEDLCLQIGLQFLANLLVDNIKNQKRVWNTCQDLLNYCFKFRNPKVRNTSAMITYNVFLRIPEFLNEVQHPYEDLIEMTMEESTSEFALFTLELLIISSSYIENFYEKLKPEFRLIILEIIRNLVTEQQNQNIPPKIIKYFSVLFTKNSDCILKTCESYADSLDPVETVKILELLVAFSSDDHQCYLEIIQKETSLLINCIILLKNIHSLSKKCGNNFTMINKISELNETEKNESIQEHPVFGFKCSLIRIIGNFCWKNKDNQNKVRELEGIPVLLDCCNIDGRNPFIIQWCILAIRNISEENIENQKFIAAMSKEGKVDAARLRELGIVLNDDGKGEAICIGPLKIENN